MPGLSLLDADFTDHDYAPHRHDALVIAVTEMGGAEFRSRGETGEARPDRLLVFNPDEPHAGHMARSPRWRYRALYLAAPALARLGTLTDGGLAYFRHNALADRDLVGRFLALHRILSDEADPLARDVALAEAFGTLFRRHGGGPPARRPPRDAARLARAIAVMRARPDEPLTLDRLAAETGLGPFRLISLFKAATGLTPHAYLIQLRLRRAIAALAAGESIAGAAQLAGFYDQAALTRHFRRAWGITPRQYRAAVAG